MRETETTHKWSQTSCCLSYLGALNQDARAGESESFPEFPEEASEAELEGGEDVGGIDETEATDGLDATDGVDISNGVDALEGAEGADGNAPAEWLCEEGAGVAETTDSSDSGVAGKSERNTSAAVCFLGAVFVFSPPCSVGAKNAGSPSMGSSSGRLFKSG